MDPLLGVDTYLSRLRASQLLEVALKALAGERGPDAVEAARLFEGELRLIGEALRLRARVQRHLVELERLREFRDEVVRAYSQKLGLKPQDRPRLRVCRSYGVTSVCLATEDTTYWVGDETVYREFTRYLQLKGRARELVERYSEILDQLAGSEYAWVRKLGRHLARELELYRTMVYGRRGNI